MLLSEFMTRLNYNLRGLDDDTPTSGDDEWNYWLDTLNMVKHNIYQDTSKEWQFSFKETSPVEPGTVTTAGTTALVGSGTYFTDYRVGDTILVSGETSRTIATITSDTALTVTSAFSTSSSSLTFTHTSIIATGVQSYNLHRRFVKESDRVYVVDSNGQRVYYDVIKPDQRSTTVDYVFISDENPQVLTFTNTIESTENIVGGTLVVPGYYEPADVSASTDTIPLPDPNWGVLQCAAEISFNDITYEDKSADLNAKANNLYRQMVKNNRRGTVNNPKRSSYIVDRRITGYGGTGVSD